MICQPLFTYAETGEKEKPFVVVDSFQSRHPLSGNNNWAVGLSELLTIELSESTQFAILDRSAVKSMIAEYTLAQQGVLKNYDSDKLSKLDQPNIILGGKHYQTPGSGIIAAKIYDVNNGLTLASRRFNIKTESFTPVIKEIRSFLEGTMVKKAQQVPDYLVAINGFVDQSNSDLYLHYSDEMQEFLNEKFLAHPPIGVVARAQMATLIQEQRLKEIVLVQAGQRISPLPKASLLIGGSYKVIPGNIKPINMSLEIEAPGFLKKMITFKAITLKDCQEQVAQYLDELLIIQAKSRRKVKKDAAKGVIEKGLKLTGPHFAQISTNRGHIDYVPMGYFNDKGRWRLAKDNTQRASIMFQAVEQFKKALTIDPENEDAMLFLGLCLMRKEVQRLNEGKGYLDKVVFGSGDDKKKNIAAHFIATASGSSVYLFPEDDEMIPEARSHLYDGMDRVGFSFKGFDGSDLRKEFPPQVSSDLLDRRRRTSKQNRLVDNPQEIKNIQEAIDNFEAAIFLDLRNFKAMLLLAFCLRDPAIGEFERADQLLRRVIQLSGSDEYNFVAADALDILDQVSFSTFFDGNLQDLQYIRKKAEKHLQELLKGNNGKQDKRNLAKLSRAYEKVILAACADFERSSSSKRSAFNTFNLQNVEKDLGLNERRRILARVWEKHPKSAPHLILQDDLHTQHNRAELVDALIRIKNFKNDLTNPRVFNTMLASKITEMAITQDNEIILRAIGSYLREIELFNLIEAYDHHKSGWILKALYGLKTLLPKDTEFKIITSLQPITVQELSAMNGLKDPAGLLGKLKETEFITSQGLPTEKWYGSNKCFTSYVDLRKLRPFYSQKYSLCRQQQSRASIEFIVKGEDTRILKKHVFSPMASLESWVSLLDRYSTRQYKKYKLQYAHSPIVKERLGKNISTADPQNNKGCGQCLSAKTATQEAAQILKSKPTAYPGTGINSKIVNIAQHDGSQAVNPEFISATKVFGPELKYFQEMIMAASDNYLVAGGGNVFHYKNNRWIPETHLVSDFPETLDNFGKAVAISGDYIIVGAPSDNAEGTVRKKDFAEIAVDIESLFEKLFQLGYLDVSGKITEKVRGQKRQSHLIKVIEKDFPEYLSPIPWSIAKVLDGSAALKNSGSAYLFKRENNKWVKTQKITAFDAAVNNVLGACVAIAGDFLFVGAYGHMPLSTRKFSGGGLYLYQRIDGYFQFQKKLMDGRVHSISITEDIAVIGGNRIKGTTLLDSEVMVYQRQGKDWAFKTDLRPKDYMKKGDSFALYGKAVFTDGNYIIIGNPWDALDVRSTGRKGSVYVFQRIVDSWKEQQKLTFTNRGSHFGMTLTMANDKLLIGAELRLSLNSSGTTVFYNLVDGVWLPKQHYVLTDTKFLDRFGSTAIITKHGAVVADSYKQSGSKQEGSLYFFHLAE